MEFRSLLEPIRNSNPFATYFEATCNQIDVEKKVGVQENAGAAAPRLRLMPAGSQWVRPAARAAKPRGRLCPRRPPCRAAPP